MALTCSGLNQSIELLAQLQVVLGQADQGRSRPNESAAPPAVCAYIPHLQRLLQDNPIARAGSGPSENVSKTERGQKHGQSKQKDAQESRVEHAGATCSTSEKDGKLQIPMSVTTPTA